MLLKQGSQALPIFQYMIFLLWGKYCCWWVIWEVKRLPWQPTQQSRICKIIASMQRCHRNDSKWDHWNRPSPKWELTLPRAAGGANVGGQSRTTPMTLSSSSWEERCWLNAAWFRAWSINSIVIASGYTDTNAEQANLPPGPHPLGARRAVMSRLLSGLRWSCQQRWEQLEIVVRSVLYESQSKKLESGRLLAFFACKFNENCHLFFRME